MPGIDRLHSGVKFNRRLLRQVLLEERATLHGSGGITVKTTGNRHVLGGPQAARQMIQVHCRITESEEDGPNRWRYKYEEVHKSKPSFAGWATFGGFIGRGYNILEDGNSDSGIQGNGIDVDTLPDGFTIRPVPTGVIVLMSLVTVAENDAPEGQFQYSNAVDGECP